MDARDLHVALTEMDRSLRALYPSRLGTKALLGYSMGAMHSLLIAATEVTNQSALIKFDRYVAIHSPVRLVHALSMLDEFYRAPLDWPAAERTDNIENTFLKLAVVSKRPPAPGTPLPFSATESKFLIGMSFRFLLRDVIFTSQQWNSPGILQHAISNLRRAPVYQEILQYSYRDYFERFAVPYYQSRDLAMPAAEALKMAGDLRTYATGLRAQPKIRVIFNQNDFLLSDEDQAWLHATFAPEQLTTFAHGGHVGNLSKPAMQAAILGALAGLKPTAP